SRAGKEERWSFDIAPETDKYTRCAAGSLASHGPLGDNGRVVSTAPFQCLQCGANLALPQDPLAFTVRCDYCKRENPLPPDVVAQRQRQAREAQAAQQAARIYQDQQQVAKTGRPVGMWIAIISVLPAIVIPIVIVMRVTSTVDNAMGNIKIPEIPSFN